jgi:hypothetical protein
VAASLIDQLAALDLGDEATAYLRPATPRLKLRRAWPRSASHLLVEYVDGAGRLCPGQWMRDAQRLAATARETARRCPRKPPIEVGPETSKVLLQPGGADRRLRALGPLLEQPGASLVSHRPERRAVVRLDAPPPSRYAKVVRPSRVRASLDALRLLEGAQDRGFTVAEITKCRPDRGVIVWAQMPGRGLNEILDRGADSTPAARAVGRALRSLHGASPDAPHLHDAAAEIAVLERWLEHVGAFIPELHARARTAAGPVMDALANEAPTAAALIHRDCHEKQFQVTDDGVVGILDLDTIARGEGALDVGNLLAHFELRVLQGKMSQSSAAEIASALIEGYEPDAQTMSRLGAWCDAARLRLACVYSFRPRWQHLGPALLDRIGHAPLHAACETAPAHPMKVTAP